MKRNKLIGLILVLAVATMAAGSILAADETDEATETTETKDIKKMDGKELFKNFCKVCHMEDSDAGEYTPMSLIMDQWDEFFDDMYPETHPALACPKDDSQKLSDVVDKGMLKKIRKFCVDHAADSEQPMTCG